MVLGKNVKFLHPFSLGKIGLEKVFGAVLDRKEAVLDYKKHQFNKKVAQLTFFQRG